MAAERARPEGVLAAITGGLRDLLSPRLLPLSIACLLLALAVTVGAAWAALHWLVPLIPPGEGVLGWLLRALELLAGAAVIVLAISFSPSVAMLIGGFLFDLAADRVEDGLGIPRGRAPSFLRGIVIALRIAIPALVVSVLTLPLVFVPVIHVALFAAINGWLMGREYFLLAALRRVGWDEALALRRALWLPVLLIGTVATFIPLVAPLFGASAMTRYLRGRTQSASGAP